MATRGLCRDGIGAALAFLRPAWKGAWAAMILAGALSALLWVLGLFSPGSPWRLAAVLAVVGAAAVVEGSLYRLALGVGAPGPGGLQLGAPEARLSAIWALTLMFMGILAMLAFVVVLSFAFAVASAGRGFLVAQPATWAAAVDGRGRMVVGVVAALASCGLIWSALRISLGAAATVAEGRVRLLATWPMTRGMAAPIMVGRLLLGCLPVGLAVTALRMASGVNAPSPALACAGASAAAALLWGLWLPSQVGFMAFLYKTLAMGRTA